MFWFLLLLLPTTILGATCPTCPTTGLWSDWTTTEQCETTCGGCSKITYTRTCLSTAMNCPCVGDTSRLMDCNTQACNWPRFNASKDNCCDGKTAQTIKNWVHCVPLPDTYTLACCPDEGYWSNWSGWSKVANQVAWQRTRTCLSGGYNCPCKGNAVDILTTCPCTKGIGIISAANNTCEAIGNKLNPYSVRIPIYMPYECKTQIVFEISSFRQQFYTSDEDGVITGAFGYFDTTGKCTSKEFVNPVKAGALLGTGQFLNYYLQCNLKDLTWEGSIVGIAVSKVTAFAQYY
ncbi:unnamed protein product [Caenorhabditis nigoni]